MRWIHPASTILGVIIVLICGASVWGASGDPEGQGSIRFSNPELSMAGSLGGCGQACLYTKANDVLSLQTEYMFQLADRLIRAREKLSEGQGASQEDRDAATEALKRNLKIYCTAQKITLKDRWDASGDRCLGHYLSATAKALEVNRISLLKYYKVITDLADSPGALPGREGLKNPGNTAKLLKNQELLKKKQLTLYPDFPFHPSFEAIDPIVRKLGEVARRKIRERGSSSFGASHQDQADQNESLVRWWESLPKCPSQDEYVKVEFVERYPNHPTGEKLPRVVTDPKTGKVVHDIPAFQAARAKCAEEVKGAFREIPLEVTAEGASLDKRQAFEDARLLMVEAMEKKFKETKGDRDFTVSLFGDGKPKKAGTLEAPGAELAGRILQVRNYAESLVRLGTPSE